MAEQFPDVSSLATDGGVLKRKVGPGSGNARRSDLAVIGGGLAAAMAAAVAVRLGMQVVVLRRPGPPPDFGEILNRRGLAVLSEVGVRGIVQPALGEPLASVRLRWPPERDQFRDVALDGTIVSVRGMTQLLFEFAQASGARFLEINEAAQLVENLVALTNCADHVIDASGAGVFASGMGLDRRPVYVNTAVHAIGQRLGASSWAHRGLSVSAAPEGWSYRLETRGPKLAAALFLRPNNVQAVDPVRLAANLIGANDGAQVATAIVRPLQCGLAFARQCRGRNWTAIGAAALGLDPLSGQGMTWALESAWHAVLAFGSGTGPLPGMNRYEDFWRETARRTHAEALSHYGECAKAFRTPFWTGAYHALRNVAMP